MDDIINVILETPVGTSDLYVINVLYFGVILLASFAVVMVLYEFLVRRFNLLRFLFGMKLRPRPRAKLETAPAG